MRSEIRNSERGWALVIAMMVMALMIFAGIVALGLADQQAREGRQERVRESSFNLSEGGLYQQSLILSRRWPRNVNLKYPANCTDTTTSANDIACPQPSALASGASGGTGGTSTSIFNANDFGVTGQNTVAWTITVRDNGSSSGPSGAGYGTPTTTYDKTVADGAQNGCANPPTTYCTWDANDDKKMWVRAEATVRGKKRMLVALVQLQQIRLPFPGNVVQAGYVHVSNSGNKTVIDTQGSASTGSQVVLGCSNGSTPSQNSNTCEGWDTNQVQPPRYCDGSQASCPKASDLYPAIKPGLLDLLEQNADLTYTNACPDEKDASQWRGVVVIHGTDSLHCKINPVGNTIINSNSSKCDSNDPTTHPGMIIIDRGTLEIGSNTIYCGIIYHPNLSQLTSVLVTLDGGSQVFGGVIIDWGGGIEVGQSSNCNSSNCTPGTIIYDPNAFSNIAAAGAAGLVQNTWRELTPTQ